MIFRIGATAPETSGPIPSPGSDAILKFIIEPQRLLFLAYVSLKNPTDQDR